MKILLVGLGSIGVRHANNIKRLRPETTLLAYRARGLPPSGLDSGVEFQAFTDLEEALSQYPEAVIIANPTALHMPVALAAIRHGCHLFIEKPLSHSLEGVEELLAEAKAERLSVMVGCNYRFHPGLRQIKQWLAEGRIGRMVSVEARAGEFLPDWHAGEDYRRGYSARLDLGGGVILTFIHELDYIYWLFGLPIRVQAVARKVSTLDIEVEDVAAITLDYGGVIAQVHLDYIQRPPERNCLFIGEEGTILWDYYKDEARLFDASLGKWEVFSNPQGFERNSMYLDEMAHFFACMDGQEIPLVPGEEGRDVLALALAAKEAAEANRVVTLPLPAFSTKEAH
ncbi:MAG: Gfo/Idh/MocA family oxidoreductase [Dehalococcoidia bacterium]